MVLVKQRINREVGGRHKMWASWKRVPLTNCTSPRSYPLSVSPKINLLDIWKYESGLSWFQRKGWTNNCSPNECTKSMSPFTIHSLSDLQRHAIGTYCQHPSSTPITSTSCLTIVVYRLRRAHSYVEFTSWVAHWLYFWPWCSKLHTTRTASHKISLTGCDQNGKNVVRMSRRCNFASHIHVH